MSWGKGANATLCSCNTNYVNHILASDIYFLFINEVCIDAHFTKFESGWCTAIYVLMPSTKSWGLHPNFMTMITFFYSSSWFLMDDCFLLRFLNQVVPWVAYWYFVQGIIWSCNNFNFLLTTNPGMVRDNNIVLTKSHATQKAIQHLPVSICQGSIVQKNHSQLSIALPSLINKFSRLTVSICSVLMYPLYIERSDYEAFKWISVLL